MSPAMHQAIQTLQANGSVQLNGAPATWSRLTGVLFNVLIGLLSILAVGGLIVLPLMAVLGFWPGGGALVGVLGALIMLVGLAILILFSRRRQQQYTQTEHQPVIIEPRGLTMRGVGPIPWTDFGPAAFRMVTAERSSGRIRRAVMELTEYGKYNVNERLPAELQERISPAMGPFWDRHHRYIYVPGVQGLKLREVMEIMNFARQLYEDNSPQ